MKVVAIVQARMGSTRLPNKVMQSIDGLPMIDLLLIRLSLSAELNEIVVATSLGKKNDPLVEHVKTLGYAITKGSEDDVLDRYYQAAESAAADVVVRITGDCPLVDPTLVDDIIRFYRISGMDYVSNTIDPTFPDGLDVEVFSFDVLKRAWKNAVSNYEREHVTPYIKESGKFSIKNFSNAENLSGERWTVDEPDDLAVIRAVFEEFSPRRNFGWGEIRSLKIRKPNLFEANRHLMRNEGATMGTGQKLWRRAKRIIPGGNMLLSKRAEMFLPEKWPAYFKKASDCRVWDLDGNEFIDMSIMGIGTNTLGYGRPEVDAAVRKVIDNGNMSTLNCPEEVYLAEKLVELHPWADMVRLARSGGEANAVAIRIARAASGKNKIAFCGYHGWHDWYLAANLGDQTTLAGHLLPGLEPNGVPNNLRETILPFAYNRIDELENLLSAHDIGVIVMEVSRNHGPQDDFLHKVKRLAVERNIVLVFDECTSGFRQTNGGLHKLYGVEPDMAMFGKALGNGYAITAVIGKRAVMEAAQTSFISSTFWTERIGPAAALATLDVMLEIRSWDTITTIGNNIKHRWQQLADSWGLSIDLWGLPALAGFTIKSSQSLAYKTLITQELLTKGYLASNCVYACTEHTPQIVDGYFSALEPVFQLIRECEDGRDVMTLLKSPICHAGFKRLN